MELFEMCILPILAVLTGYLVQVLRAKTADLKAKYDSTLNQKYLDMIENTIETCVIATNQTYVDSLKAQGKFDAEAQKLAFEKTLDAVIATLTAESKDYISNLSIDLNVYLTQRIEAAVSQNK